MASKDIPVVHEVADEAEIKSTPTAGAGKRKSRLWETDFQLLPQLSSDGKPVGKCRKCGWTANAVGSQAAAMNTCLLNLLREWGIQHKIYSITLDNASSCNKLQDLLRASLSHEHPLPANGEYFHVRCGAHILNLIVQDGLKLIDEAVVKLRKATNWVDASEGRILAFVDCAKRAGCLVKKGLSRDSLTRWNSTWDMIDRALIYKPAFLLLGEEDKNFTHKLTESEWFRTERIWKLLKPFSHITEVFSGSKYPTANLYFSHVYDIELTLRQEMRSDDECIKTMATAMKEKFDKYWANYSMVLCFAVVLDPYLKLDYIKFSYEELYPTDHEQKVAEVVSAIEKLFETYSVDQADENVGASIRTSNVTHPTSRDAAFDLYEPSRLSSSKSELQLYMADLRLIRPPKYDVLAWWKANEGRYPCLSKMARDVMAIPITTVASESTFSLGGRILTKFRQSTLPENAEAIVQTRSWLNSAENLKDEVQLKVAESTIDFNAFLDGNQNKTARSSALNT